MGAAGGTAVGPASAPSAAQPPPAAAAPATVLVSASPTTGTVISFDRDAVGAPSPAFEGIVGDWYVASTAGAQGLEVDGGRWRSGTPSVNLADQAKRLYGDRYAEFLDGVKAFAFYPFAVWKSDPPAGDLRISVRFFPIAGRVDQAAGIAFAITPDGTYLGFRANALEDNLLFFRVVKGKRTILDTIRNVPTPSRTWHTLAVELRGKQLTAELDGKKRFERALDAEPRGRIGLWSKADSQVLFDDFKVEVLGPATTAGAEPGPGKP
ncbi:MAG: hypothetical protein ABI895_16880 [Deltaproteobacteria bacterium]